MMYNKIIAILLLGLLTATAIPVIGVNSLSQELDEEIHHQIDTEENDSYQLATNSQEEKFTTIKDISASNKEELLADSSKDYDNVETTEEIITQTVHDADTLLVSGIKYTQPYFDDWDSIITGRDTGIGVYPVNGIDLKNLPLFVTTKTYFQLEVKDIRELPRESIDLYYRIWNLYNDWSEWTIYKDRDDNPYESVKKGFTLKYEGLHIIEYYAKDDRGNIEKPVHRLTCMVDDTPPVTSTSKNRLFIILDATDHTGKHVSDRFLPYEDVPVFLPVWLHHIHYRYKIGNNGIWSSWKTGDLNQDIVIQPGIRYFIGMPIYVEFYAEDILGNREIIKNEVFEYNNPFFPL